VCFGVQLCCVKLTMLPSLLKVMSLLATYESAADLNAIRICCVVPLKFDLPFCNVACFQVAVGTASLSHVVCVCVCVDAVGPCTEHCLYSCPGHAMLHTCLSG